MYSAKKVILLLLSITGLLEQSCRLLLLFYVAFLIWKIVLKNEIFFIDFIRNRGSVEYEDYCTRILF